MPIPHEPISVVEDLDPEPPTGAKHRRREMVLGVLLVAAVLSFALWQWWRTDNQQQNYAAGRQAAWAAGLLPAAATHCSTESGTS